MNISNTRSLQDSYLLNIGTPEALNQLFAKHYSKMLGIAYSICRHKSDAEEVTQEAFLKASKGISKFRSDSKFSTWLHRITVNTALDSIRKRAKKSKLKKEYGEVQNVLKNNIEDKLLVDLQVAIKQLPDTLQQTLKLVVYQGFSHKEAANILGCAETTVSWRIFQAKKKLKKKLR